MNEPKTIKVKPWGKDQGDHVIINESDFDPDFHQMLDEAKSDDGGASTEIRAALNKALAELPDGNTDPDYVVNAMRNYFGPIFTVEDEAKVRELVTAPEPKPSDGLTVEQLKTALADKGVAIPEGAKKADLAKLLDEAK
jgi:hypothetical protein